MDGLDGPPELVRDVQLVGVEQQDDPGIGQVNFCVRANDVDLGCYIVHQS